MLPRLGVGNDSNYNHAICFNRFPFPAEARPELQEQVRAEGEALDAARKGVLNSHTNLTLTGLYNVLEAVREGRPLSDEERDVHNHGLVSLLRQHHDTISGSRSGWPIAMAASRGRGKSA